MRTGEEVSVLLEFRSIDDFDVDLAASYGEKSVHYNFLLFHLLQLIYF